MSNNSIQVVLNTDSMLENIEPPQGGSRKDFFASMDEEFGAHKDKLARQLSLIKELQVTNRYAKMSYAKVSMRQSALAKSHRPTSAIFPPDISPVVGAGDPGVLFVELKPDSIDETTARIERAEVQSRTKVKDGKTIPKPSQYRCEVGAIDDITPYSEEDKRKFSVNEAVEWLVDPRSGGAYIVELFKDLPPRGEWFNHDKESIQLFDSFVRGLESIQPRPFVEKMRANQGSAIILYIGLEESDSSAIELISSDRGKEKTNRHGEIILDVSLHEQLLGFLGHHPLVKQIMLPPLVQISSTSVFQKKGQEVNIPEINREQKYPKLCVVDGGVSELFEDWVVDRWDLISPVDKDVNHGSFIAGLAILGQDLNGDEICKELNGCHIIDLDILPNEHHEDYYSSPIEFFDELEVAVHELKARANVRIFNFSLNMDEHYSTRGYSVAAQILDRIAEENDVIFIISAGNMAVRDLRPEWSADPVTTLSSFATSTNDSIKSPAESCRNISVSALNPPNMNNIVPYGFTTYSRRGIGPSFGLKPDLTHVGGGGTRTATNGHGLYSVDGNGLLQDGCGTSFAAPLVAKTFASLENSIEGDISRETLIALNIHNAVTPAPFKEKGLEGLSKYLIGFGLPRSSTEILEGDDNTITLIFANRVLPGKKMNFNFSWPSCLVKNGRCTGFARLTIVSTPPLDYRFGAELVRINVKAALRQLQLDGGYKGRLKAVYMPNKLPLLEKDLIEYSFKWSPVKVHEAIFPRGVGPTTDWQLAVEYLARDGVQVPHQGVPFTAILTISDPNREEPVFNEMRQTLSSLGVTTVNIETATRVTPRV